MFAAAAAAEFHGAGTFTDPQHVEWKGKFYNGVGPGLSHGSVVAS